VERRWPAARVRLGADHRMDGHVAPHSGSIWRCRRVRARRLVRDRTGRELRRQPCRCVCRRFESAVDDLAVACAVPQESGHRADLRELAVTGQSLPVLTVEAKPVPTCPRELALWPCAAGISVRFRAEQVDSGRTKLEEGLSGEALPE
jgi:hypothetical protein